MVAHKFKPLPRIVDAIRPKPSPIEVYVEAEIRDADGRLVKLVGPKRSRSWVLAMITHLYGPMFNRTESIKDTTGTSRTIPYLGMNLSYFMRVDAGATVTAHGIRAGTSTQAVISATTSRMATGGASAV